MCWRVVGSAPVGTTWSGCFFSDLNRLPLTPATGCRAGTALTPASCSATVSATPSPAPTVLSRPTGAVLGSISTIWRMRGLVRLSRTFSVHVVRVTPGTVRSTSAFCSQFVASRLGGFTAAGEAAAEVVRARAAVSAAAAARAGRRGVVTGTPRFR